MPKLTNILNLVRRQPRWRLVVASLAVLLLGWWALKRGGNSGSAVLTFAARRGPLEITVLEGGSLQALESQEIKCEVRVGYNGTKILKIVEEGYLVTEEDVRTNKVLCELDSSDLQKQIVQQEIQYQTALASLTDAQQNYEIQLGQNESDLKAAMQKTRFARMDFDKFLGDTVTPEIITQIGLDSLIAASATNNVEETTHAEEVSSEKTNPALSVKLVLPGDAIVAPPATAVQPVKVSQSAVAPTITVARPASSPDAASQESNAPSSEPPGRLVVDFSKFANIDMLGDGEAKQKLRKLEDDLQVAQKELGQATTALEGTRRLFTKGFVPKMEVTRDEIAHESSRLKVQTAETARALYLKYEFNQSAETALSKYVEALREQDKARRLAISKLAQARARLNSAKGQYEVQSRQRKDLNEQLEKCTLLAKQPGLVVYGGGGDQMIYYGNQEPIREGATVRERQAIITIPDLSRMSVSVKIHESYIKKVKKGLKARITVDAFPDEQLTGEISKVGVLPDSQNRWMSPDLKVYLTTVTIDGTHDWVKPGMSAKVEILVNKLEDVVYVPVQAVSPDNGKQICYVAGAFKPERREVEIGEFTDEFIQIKSGLKEGERVLLRLPDGVETNRNGKEGKSPDKNGDKPATPNAPATEAAATGKA
ncbi:MAG TPA: efflux RND transporter periplasmic adaptor subunit [Verrucomicrobiae bacterium]|nr:efflux RND transporter periplasmic adaptor subunit [Verrucomicrobiae bacterium]